MTTPLIHQLMLQNDLSELELLLNNSVNSSRDCTSDGNGFCKSVDVNQVDESGRTGLHMSAMTNNLECLNLLLATNVEVNRRDNDGLTPLHISARRGNVDCARALLQAGALVNISRFRLSGTTSSTPLHLASSGGHLEVVELLLNHGANISSTSGSWCGKPALNMAVREGHLDVVRLLHRRGASVNVASTRGWFAVHQACANGHLRCLAYLLDAGADIEAKDLKKRTPLSVALEASDLELVKLLLLRGAVVGRPESLLGRDGATSEKSVTCARLMIHFGASCDLPDWNYFLVRNSLQPCLPDRPLPLKFLCRLNLIATFRLQYPTVIQSISGLPLQIRSFLLLEHNF